MNFKIGSFAVLCNTTPHNELEGQRCEILTELVPQIVTDSTGQERMVMGHEVLLANGEHVIAIEACLQSIVGVRDMDKPARWEDCAWRPNARITAKLSALAKIEPPTSPKDELLTRVRWIDCAWSPYQKIDCMILARELHQVRQRSAELRRRLS